MSRPPIRSAAGTRSGQRQEACRPDPDVEIVLGKVSVSLHDNDATRSCSTGHHLWWSSKLPRQTFLQFTEHALRVTKRKIGTAQVRLGDPGTRRAMPYFFAVLRNELTEVATARRVQQDAPAGAASSAESLPLTSGLFARPTTRAAVEGRWATVYPA